MTRGTWIKARVVLAVEVFVSHDAVDPTSDQRPLPRLAATDAAREAVASMLLTPATPMTMTRSATSQWKSDDGGRMER